MGQRAVVCDAEHVCCHRSGQHHIAVRDMDVTVPPGPDGNGGAARPLAVYRNLRHRYRAEPDYMIAGQTVAGLVGKGRGQRQLVAGRAVECRHRGEIDAFLVRGLGESTCGGLPAAVILGQDEAGTIYGTRRHSLTESHRDRRGGRHVGSVILNGSADHGRQHGVRHNQFETRSSYVPLLVVRRTADRYGGIRSRVGRNLEFQLLCCRRPAGWVSNCDAAACRARRRAGHASYPGIIGHGNGSRSGFTRSVRDALTGTRQYHSGHCAGECGNLLYRQGPLVHGYFVDGTVQHRAVVCQPVPQVQWPCGIANISLAIGSGSPLDTIQVDLHDVLIAADHRGEVLPPSGLDHTGGGVQSNLRYTGLVLRRRVELKVSGGIDPQGVLPVAGRAVGGVTLPEYGLPGFVKAVDVQPSGNGQVPPGMQGRCIDHGYIVIDAVKVNRLSVVNPAAAEGRSVVGGAVIAIAGIVVPVTVHVPGAKDVGIALAGGEYRRGQTYRFAGISGLVVTDYLKRVFPGQERIKQLPCGRRIVPHHLNTVDPDGGVGVFGAAQHHEIAVSLQRNGIHSRRSRRSLIIAHVRIVMLERVLRGECAVIYRDLIDQAFEILAGSRVRRANS